MRERILGRLLRWVAGKRVLAALMMLAVSLSASAQSCSLCYTQAASASSRFIQALRSGILVLIFPPLLISLAITILAYRKRNQFRSDQGSGCASPGSQGEIDQPAR